nr:reverse transcriptase domain-containing protein [Tanacetum cinerariifolium]
EDGNPARANVKQALGRDAPNDAIKLMLFPYSLEGAARIWYEKEPPNSILTWDDLVNKFVNQFFPTSKTTHLKNEISRFTQRFEEIFGEVVERETEETTDKEQPNCQGITAHIQPLVVPTPIPEPDVPKTQPKPNIPYPSILNDQKLREKATNQMEKFFQIFHDLNFDISFADALLLMPKFASTIKSLLRNKDKLFELDKVPLNENCSAMLLKKLPKKFGDPEKFLIPCDFLRMDVNDESVAFNLNQTMRYSSTYDDNLVNRIDVIDIAYEEYAQGVLDFKYNFKSGNPTLVSNPPLSKETKSEFCKEPIVKSSSPTLTPFRENDFLLEEIKDFLKDESIRTRIEDSCYDPEGDILYLEKLLNDDQSQLPPMDLKQAKETKAKSSIEKPLKLELKELPSHLEYAFL